MPYERLAVLCALLGVLTTSCRLRTVSALVAIFGVVLLFLDVHSDLVLRTRVCPFRSGYMLKDMPCLGYRKKPLTMEHMEPDPEAEDVTMEQKEPEPPPPPPEKTTPDVVQHVAPPSDSNILDDELYAAGLVVSDYSAGSNYARYVRPKVPQNVSGRDVADQAHGRDRRKRVVPHTRVFFGQPTIP